MIPTKLKVRKSDWSDIGFIGIPNHLGRNFADSTRAGIFYEPHKSSGSTV